MIPRPPGFWCDRLCISFYEEPSHHTVIKGTAISTAKTPKSKQRDFENPNLNPKSQIRNMNMKQYTRNYQTH
ncbi:hypothetical protein EUTSA_v10000412mg [Eutrema salsugineum]|uniref:Uncharacterized protein n=1 Tax=Eutrema salsugineum TaxID=72664 RepID=V4LVS3_EUTSA|nr:hypothetical protein EUTSA_v10000412mg [Eutrema salsugineum]